MQKLCLIPIISIALHVLPIIPHPLINALHVRMHTRVIVLCLSACLRVCHQSRATAYNMCVTNWTYQPGLHLTPKVSNMQADFALNTFFLHFFTFFFDNVANLDILSTIMSEK